VSVIVTVVSPPPLTLENSSLVATATGSDVVVGTTATPSPVGVFAPSS
jgi:hypothetical protein